VNDPWPWCCGLALALASAAERPRPFGLVIDVGTPVPASVGLLGFLGGRPASSCCHAFGGGIALRCWRVMSLASC